MWTARTLTTYCVILFISAPAFGFSIMWKGAGWYVRNNYISEGLDAGPLATRGECRSKIIDLLKRSTSPDAKFYCTYHSPKTDAIKLPSVPGWYVVDLVWGVVMRKEIYETDEKCEARIVALGKQDPEFVAYCWHIGDVTYHD
jgi:hypothetical protein